jgi:hypothetical protein
MKKFTIQRRRTAKVYNSPLFNLSVYKVKNEFLPPLVIFCNGSRAIGIEISRKEAARILRNNFKNDVDRRIERA